MTPEQKVMWDHLSANYPTLTHEMAAKIVQADKRWFHRKANKFLGVINTWPIEDAVRAMRTWLTIYHIPLSPSKLSNYHAFYERCGAYILEISLDPHTRKFETFPIAKEIIAY